MEGKQGRKGDNGPAGSKGAPMMLEIQDHKEIQVLQVIKEKLELKD